MNEIGGVGYEYPVLLVVLLGVVIFLVVVIFGVVGEGGVTSLEVVVDRGVVVEGVGVPSLKGGIPGGYLYPSG